MVGGTVESQSKPKVIPNTIDITFEGGEKTTQESEKLYSIYDDNLMINSKEIIDSIRNNKEPAILEVVTYRWYGHVDWREDIDVGVSRSIEDIKNWKARDPIQRLSKSMINSKIWTKDEENELSNKIDLEIKNYWEKAMSDPYPSKESILNFVYSED